MAANRSKFLGPNAGTLRDPTSNALDHGRMRNPPRMMEMGGFDSTRKGFHKNDKKLASVAGSVV
jgi:hypothetical protein